MVWAAKWFKRSLKNNYGVYFSVAFFVTYFGFLRRNPISSQLQQGDQKFRSFLEYAFSDLLFSNEWIDDLTGKALYDLTQVPEY